MGGGEHSRQEHVPRRAVMLKELLGLSLTTEEIVQRGCGEDESDEGLGEEVEDGEETEETVPGLIMGAWSRQGGGRSALMQRIVK